jgi:hypothetical protein
MHAEGHGRLGQAEACWGMMRQVEACWGMHPRGPNNTVIVQGGLRRAEAGWAGRGMQGRLGQAGEADSLQVYSLILCKYTG